MFKALRSTVLSLAVLSSSAGTALAVPKRTSGKKPVALEVTEVAWRLPSGKLLDPMQLPMFYELPQKNLPVVVRFKTQLNTAKTQKGETERGSLVVAAQGSSDGPSPVKKEVTTQVDFGSEDEFLYVLAPDAPTWSRQQCSSVEVRVVMKAAGKTETSTVEVSFEKEPTCMMGGAL
jgi:hypothetical protein